MDGSLPPILTINGKFCLSETTITLATLAPHIHTIPFWNQHDPRFENMSLNFEVMAPIGPPQIKRMQTIQRCVERGEVQVQAS